NSITSVPEFLKALPYLVERKISGIYNFVNPGVERHDWVKEIMAEFRGVSTDFKIIEDQELKGPRRSHCILNSDKLKKCGVILSSIDWEIQRLASLYCSRSFPPNLKKDVSENFFSLGRN